MAVDAKIIAVSYLNTIPFIYGLRHHSKFGAELLLAPPADCYKNFVEGKADIALMPAAMVPSLPDAEIVTDYCIGASGDVRTVVVVSNTPIERVQRILLDPHSKTSVQLCGYLAKNLWHIEPEWVELDDYALLDTPTDGDAYLIIGDKVFDNEGKFRYSYDLASEWHRTTGLPFAFAVWVARKGLSYDIHDELQAAFTFGVEHIYEAILESDYADRDYAYEYLTRNIDFLFDIQKHNALKKFWDFGLKVKPKVNPG
ncbi:MAG: ABC transporter substrate-binding protein [Rikenellaceae bacterium]|nr:ABC transporter substrate-binding protein [Rikenellaceae bacterium]